MTAGYSAAEERAAEERAARALARRATAGRPLCLWLRDDDAVAPSPALERLLTATGAAAVPLTLAVIPSPWQDAPTGQALAARLADTQDVLVAVHGWAHHNHAPEGVKRQELGLHRPVGQIRAELRAGLDRLSRLHGPRFLPMLVPPWNRVAPDLLPHLAGDGFTTLSTFGTERPAPGLGVLNTQIDIIDWRNGRVGRPAGALWQELAAQAEAGARHLGVLTHHLVHDDRAWAFLDRLFALMRDNGGAWRTADALLAGDQPDAPSASRGIRSE